MLKFSLLKSDTESTHSTPRSQARGMLSLPAGRQGLILHFDKLSVLSLSLEAALLTPV